VVRRHDSVRDWLAKLVTEWTGKPALTEQLVPNWNRQKNGHLKLARLDVALDTAQGKRVYIDVAITEAATSDAHELRQRAAGDGVAASRKEDHKRVKYPGPELLPFVVEALGRCGSSANSFLKAMAPKSLDDRSKALGSARQSLSVLVQTGMAELLLSAL
jgi:hypothetical protein